MTDPMELARRLEAKNAPGHINIIDSDTTEQLLDLLAEAAACIREMVEQKAAMQARLDRREPRAPMLPVGERKRCNKILAALRQAYPRTCFVCGLGPCRDEIIPHNLPPAPGAEA